MADPSPFRPGFGATPPLLVGRDDLIADFATALDYGLGSSDRSALLTGACGTGKTVMLNALEDVARRKRWAVVSETATPGFVARLRDTHLPVLLDQLRPPRSRIAGITMPANLGGLTWDPAALSNVAPDLRTRMSLAADALTESRAGLLITIDEIHAVAIPELRELAAAVQHAFREGREVAFVGAGLTAAISDVLNDHVLTFLRRAERHQLGEVSRADVRRALREPIEAAGWEVTEDALATMTQGTEGYPFLIQLVGHRSWIAAGGRELIDRGAAAHGVADARRRLGNLVHEPALASCSDIDKTFLAAMAKDCGPSRMADIQRRLGDASKQYVNQYRKRLIDQELIAPVGRGTVGFALPGLREHLIGHAVVDLDW
ncbi:MAG: ATP-binding protein [Actinomycetia bacterium]|nr:ATP-binding protein [Actinomycetes bacterium]